MLGTDPVAARLGQVIQAMEKPIGFNVVLDPTEFVTSLNHEDAGKFETFAIGWSGRIDADGNTFNFLQTTGSQNDSGYSNAVVDRALDERAEGGVGPQRRLVTSTRRSPRRPRTGRSSTSTTRSTATRESQEGRRRPALRRRARRACNSRASRSSGRATGDHGRLPPAQGRGRPDRHCCSRACSSSPACGRSPATRRLALGAENRDPAVVAAIRHKYGLDQPLPMQYVNWVEPRGAGRPRHRPARAAGRAHDRAAAADHARARRSSRS